MSVFRNIMSRIFGRGAEAIPAQGGAQAPEQSPSRVAPETLAPGAQDEAGRFGGQVAQPSGSAAGPAPMATQGGAQVEPVDVEAVLSGMAAGSGQQLNWRTSIVDLMKLLGLDSSLAARKELAEELGYTGARDGSAEMNTWLHRQVMRRLAENGGRVPDELKR
ncbi:DUF3597 domain-containing protein [Falsiroseomonas oryziterrae]|uniref:DUF3597 domain-containing protein n=1 Tax=Falsiroseomonas oryziterrae TaxID=2911368 RepID=UPI001F443629|nr:DUF3597 domain-containing protein [Roseomonas sp. NPKOSM-4]